MIEFIIGLILIWGIYRITKAIENFVPVQIIENYHEKK